MATAKKPAAPAGKKAMTSATAAKDKPTKASTGHVLETGIAVPSRQTAVNKYPFRDMEIGQTFREPVEGVLDKGAATKLGRSIGSAASRYAKGTPKKFTTRVLSADDGSGWYVRCWRIEPKKADAAK